MSSPDQNKANVKAFCDLAFNQRPLAPTVVLGVTDEMKIAHEEIFGPIHPQHGAHHHG